MKKLFTTLTNMAIYGYAGFGAIVWVFNQFGVDVLAIIEHSSVNAAFYGTTGGLLGIAKISQVVIRTVLTKYETRVTAQQQTFLQSIAKVLDVMENIMTEQGTDQAYLSTIMKQLNLQIGFNKILADKNLKSVILDDNQRQGLEDFIAQSELIK